MLRLIVELLAGDDLDRLRHVLEGRVGLGGGHRIGGDVALRLADNDDGAAFLIGFGFGAPDGSAAQRKRRQGKSGGAGQQAARGSLKSFR